MKYLFALVVTVMLVQQVFAAETRGQIIHFMKNVDASLNVLLSCGPSPVSQENDQNLLHTRTTRLQLALPEEK